MRGTLLLNQVGQPDGVEDDGFFVRLRVQPLEIVLICNVITLIIPRQRIPTLWPRKCHCEFWR
jgi:hypothetical protein